VYAFEPLPRNLEMLRRHVALNTSAGGKCAGNVTVIDAAVSDLDGTATFMPDVTPDRAHIVGTGDRHASVEADQASATTQGITVRTVRIDTLAAGMPGVGAEGLGAPGLIKIDVEGAEAMVLRGAAKTVAQYRPTIFLATHGDAVHAECLAILRSWDYELTPIDGTDIDKVEELVARPR
jgi:FkbM family methyltransferase